MLLQVGIALAALIVLGGMFIALWRGGNRAVVPPSHPRRSRQLDIDVDLDWHWPQS